MIRPACIVNPRPVIPAATSSRTLSGRKYSAARVDAILQGISDKILADPSYYTQAAISLNIGGDNQAPSGTYRAPTGAGGKATSGMEAIYAMNHNAAHPWTVTYNGGIAVQKLIGNDDKSWELGGMMKDVLGFQKFTAVAGTLAEIRIKCSGNGHAQVAIYSDNAGHPGAVLAYAMGATVASGWNTIPLNTTVNLSATNYWLAHIYDTNALIYRSGTGGVGKYKNLAYGSSFPDSPMGLSDSTTDRAIAGWGLLSA